MRFLLLSVSICLSLCAVSYAQDLSPYGSVNSVATAKVPPPVDRALVQKPGIKSPHSPATIGYPFHQTQLDNFGSSQPAEKQKKEGKIQARVNSLEASYLYQSGRLVNSKARYLHSLSRLEHPGFGTKEITAILAKLPQNHQKFMAGYIVPNLTNPEFPDITIGHVAWRTDVVVGRGESVGGHIIAKIEIQKKLLSVDVIFAFNSDTTHPEIEVKIFKSAWLKDRDNFILDGVKLRANATVEGYKLPGALVRRDDQRYVHRLPTSRDGAYALLKMLSEGRWIDLEFKTQSGKRIVVTFERTQFGEAALLLAARGGV